jgi:hypothetical protein
MKYLYNLRPANILGYLTRCSLRYLIDDHASWSDDLRIPPRGFFQNCNDKVFLSALLVKMRYTLQVYNVYGSVGMPIYIISNLKSEGYELIIMQAFI